MVLFLPYYRVELVLDVQFAQVFQSVLGEDDAVDAALDHIGLREFIGAADAFAATQTGKIVLCRKLAAAETQSDIADANFGRVEKSAHQ